MAESSEWITHDCDTRDDIKMIKLMRKFEWQGYGLWWGLLEVMRKADELSIKVSDIDAIAFDFRVDANTLKIFVDECISLELFSVEDDFVYSKSLKERALKYRSICEKRRGAANAKHLQSKCKTTNEQLQSNCDAKQGTVRKGKVRKGKVRIGIGDVEFPSTLDAPLPRQTFASWIAHREEIKKPLTKRSAEMILRKYADRPVDFIRDIEHSIANGWQGVFSPARGGAAKPSNLDLSLQAIRDTFKED